MAVTLRKYLNNQLKAKGLTVKEAQKNAGKYKSISAAKKAGSLYYTNKDGKVMAAVYAEDLKKPLKPNEPPVAKPSELTIKKVTVTKLPPKGPVIGRSLGEREDISKIKKVVEKALASPKATKFDKWYKKNKSKYKTKAKAMEAYKKGPGRTESTRYGNSKGSLQKKLKSN